MPMERRPPDHPAAVFHDTQCAADYDADRFGGAFGRYLEEREVIGYIIEAKKPETRERRAAKTVDLLEKGWPKG